MRVKICAKNTNSPERSIILNHNPHCHFLANARKSDCLCLMVNQTGTSLSILRDTDKNRNERVPEEKEHHLAEPESAVFSLSLLPVKHAGAASQAACCFIMTRLGAKRSQAWQISYKHKPNKSFYSFHHW